MNFKQQGLRNILVYILLFSSSAIMLSCSNSSNVKETSAFEPEATLEEANDLIRQGYYEEAREKLESIAGRDASTRYAVIARLRIGDAYFEDELYEEAATEYENFLNLHAYHKLAPYAQYKLAMSYFKRIRTPDVSYSYAMNALKEFQKLQHNYPRNPYMDVTESRIKMCRRVLAEYEFYVGEFYFKKGSYEAAINRFKGLIKKYPESRKVSEALYYIGLSYQSTGQRERAMDALSELVDKYPTTELSNEARKILASYNSE